MSPEVSPRPHWGRRYGWWIAGGIVAAVLLAFAVRAAVVNLSEPLKIAYGFMSGNPSFPNCNSTVKREDTTGPLWYRLVDVDCPGDLMHFVYVTRGTGPGFMVFPAFMSTGSPVPVSLRQAGDAFEIVLAEPLADGRAALPLAFAPNGFIQMQAFDHGHEAKSGKFGS